MKGKGSLKIKNDDSGKEEDILPDGVMKQLMKNLLKNSLVKVETDEENESKPNKKGKKKEKVLTPDEIRHQDYVKKLPGEPKCKAKAETNSFLNKLFIFWFYVSYFFFFT